MTGETMEITRDSSGPLVPGSDSAFMLIPSDLRARPIQLTDNARTVLQKRYLRRDEDGQPAESEHEMFWRVAYNVALAEAQHDGDVLSNARRFYDILTNLEFFPNSPTFTGAGTPLGQLAACFVLRIDDDMGRSESGIFQTLRNAALIQQTGGGNGFSFSRLRPKGAIVRSSNGQATGPVGFLRVYDQAFGEIAQGGCLTPDTLVFTDKGLLRLDEIVTHSEPGWRTHSMSVPTDEGLRDSTQTYNNGAAPVLRVTTDAGLQLTGTPNHKLKVMTASGPMWRRFDELQAGDALIVKLGQHMGTLQTLTHPIRQHGNQVMPNFPSMLDEEFAFFLGCFVGDGFMAAGAEDHRVGMSVAHDSYLMNEMPALITRLFGDQVSVHTQQKDNDASVTFVMDNRAVKDFLTLNGLAKTRSTSAQVPRLIRQSTPQVVGAFLRGLCEADGALSHGYPSLLSSSETLIREVAALLIGLGCPVRIKRQITDSQEIAWSVTVADDQIDNLAAEPAYASTVVNSSIRTTRGPFAEHARAINDQWFVTIASVESAGESLTLDFEVNDNHTYLANGIVSHNSRRGANMAVLRIDHPDVREFITCKTNESSITNFNISVGITDKFMRAVEADGDFDLINPQDGSVWETVRARELFDLIIKQAHHNGEPGVLFLDAANRQNPVPHLYELESTNPCGEQFLGPFENCCLGSINLVNTITADKKVDWAHLQTLVETSTRFLDDVVTANKYVPAVPQLEIAAHAVRRIGLGIMGLGDLMYKLGVRYGSEEGQEFAGQIIEFVRYHAMKTSISLAKERGSFPAIKGSIYDPDNLKWQAPKPLFPYTRNWERPTLDWDKITSKLKKHGIRNGAQLTVAPTGTIATVSGCEAYGCEPVFALSYIRHVNDKGRDLQLQYTSPLFEKALRDAGLNTDQITAIVEEVNVKGSCQDVSSIPERIRHTFVVSSDISAEEHVRMQAAMQAFVDNAISKTINAPSTFTESDVAAVYKLGWKLGCKGMTVYVTGSRDKVVLETHATVQAKQKDEAVMPVEALQTPQLALMDHAVHAESALPLTSAVVKKDRPRELIGRTFQVGTPLGKTYVTINENGEGRGQPFEIFTHTSKAGSETAAVSEAIGRMISLVLRLTSPISPRERVKEIIRQLEGIGGGRSTGFGAARVRSLPDGIAQILSEYIAETEAALSPVQASPQVAAPAASKALPIAATNNHTDHNDRVLPISAGAVTAVGDLCPECGEASLVSEEGCRKCYSCAYSEC